MDVDIGYCSFLVNDEDEFLSDEQAEALGLPVFGTVEFLESLPQFQRLVAKLRKHEREEEARRLTAAASPTFPSSSSSASSLLSPASHSPQPALAAALQQQLLLVTPAFEPRPRPELRVVAPTSSAPAATAAVALEGNDTCYARKQPEAEALKGAEEVQAASTMLSGVSPSERDLHPEAFQQPAPAFGPRAPSSVCGKRKEREEGEHAEADAQPPAAKKGRTAATPTVVVVAPAPTKPSVPQLPPLVGLFLLVLCAFGRQIFVLLERQGPKDAWRVFIACADAEFIAQHFSSKPALEYNRKNATTVFRKMGPAALPFGGRTVALLRQRAGTNATSQSLLFTTGAAFLARLAYMKEQEKAKGHTPLPLTRAMLDASRYDTDSCRLSRHTSPDGSTSLTRGATLTAPQLAAVKEAFYKAIGL